MSEENQSQETPNQEVTQEQTQAVEYSPAESRAMEKGWIPKDKYDGDPAAFRSAELYLELEPFYKTVSALKRKNVELEGTLTTLASHHKKVAEVEYARALNDLKQQKKVALNEGDTDAVVELDEQIQDLKIEQKSVKQEQTAQQVEVPKELTEWKSQNTWYESDPELTKFANSVATHLQYEMTPTELLREIAKRTRKTFPEKFTNPNRDRAAAVAPSSGKPAGANSDRFKLTDEQTQVMRKLVKNNVMTEKEYIEDLKKLG